MIDLQILHLLNGIKSFHNSSMHQNVLINISRHMNYVISVPRFVRFLYLLLECVRLTIFSYVNTR